MGTSTDEFFPERAYKIVHPDTGATLSVILGGKLWELGLDRCTVSLGRVYEGVFNMRSGKIEEKLVARIVGLHYVRFSDGEVLNLVEI